MLTETPVIVALIAVAAVVFVMIFMFTVCAGLLALSYWLTNKSRLVEIERSHALATMLEARSSRLDNKGTEIYSALASELGKKTAAVDYEAQADAPVDSMVERLAKKIRAKEGFTDPSGETALNGLREHSVVHARAYNPDEGI